jgi:hypothetical protein
MIVTERDTDEGLLVTVCDSAILGETFENDEVSLTVTEEFYGGEEADENAVVDSLSRASVANIVGTESVALAIEHGFVDETNVLDVGGTRHAQLLRIA